MKKIAIFTSKSMGKLLNNQRMDLYVDMVSQGYAELFYLEDNFLCKKTFIQKYYSILIEEPAFLSQLNVKAFYKEISMYELPIFTIISDYFLFPFLLKKFIKYYRINHIFVNHETAPLLLRKILPNHIFYDFYPFAIANKLPRIENIKKQNDILYTGSNHPLQGFRQRLFNLLSKNFVVKKLFHPGNRPDKKDKSIISGYSYLEELSKSYFVINCTTNNQISTRKCYEIPACASSIIGNLQKDNTLTKIYENTVLVNPNMSDMKILDLVSEALKNKELYFKKAKENADFYRQNFSSKKISKLIKSRILFLVESGLYYNQFIPPSKSQLFREIFYK